MRDFVTESYRMGGRPTVGSESFTQHEVLNLRFTHEDIFYCIIYQLTMYFNRKNSCARIYRHFKEVNINIYNIVLSVLTTYNK